MDITIPNVDMSILKLQHQDLMEELWLKPDSILWGLVEMLDYVIDNYDQGIDNELQSVLDFTHTDNKE